ncbi:hypothetical protein K0040_12715 [Terrisporobacter petrolearius]|uniref:hypothetical protein n=1 Tax=Terrisporobacter petrolearius TaxID=1460447 RepID=UPI001D1631A0|nr:hypothetical protein [Terrisporobacter petrolearius]MCC3865135.1 hypothetical protein [Terrisporobacter petrolearius]
MKNLVKIEIKKCLKRKEFIFILLLMIIAISTDFTLTSMYFYGCKTSQLLSAHNGIIIKNIIRTPLQPVFGVLLPLTVSIIGSDIYLEEQINGTENIMNTRISKKDNIISKAIAISIISFFIVLIPLLINQILALIAFPIQGHGSFREAGYKQLIYIDKGIMLSKIQAYYPYLNNIIFMIIRSISAVLFTLISYGFSFIPKINKYLGILSSFIVHTLLTTVLSLITIVLFNIINESLAEAMRTDILGVNGYGNIYMLFGILVIYLIVGIFLINRGIKIKNEV